MKRVVVTGVGAISPAGIGIVPTHTALSRMTSLIQAVRESESLSTLRIGAPAAATAAARTRVHALAASAIEDALRFSTREHVSQFGLAFGTAISSTIEMEQAFKGERRLTSEEFRFGTITDALAEEFGLGGARYTVTTGCAAGLDTIGLAFDRIRANEASGMVAAASDATLCPIVFAAFSQIGALAKTNDVSVASVPFGHDRSGFVLGEAAAALTLEALDEAQRRRPLSVLVEVLGWASISNAFHMTGLRRDGSDLARLIRLLLDRTGVQASEVDIVDVHGTSTKMNDEAEARALLEVFGSRIRTLTVSSQKYHFAHALGASNALEVANLCMILQEGIVPPFEPAYALDPLVRFRLHRDQSVPARCAVKLSSSFAGIHTAMMFARVNAT